MALEFGGFADDVARRDGVVTAIRHVLRDIAAERYVVPATVVGLGEALDDALDPYSTAVAVAEGSEQR